MENFKGTKGKWALALRQLNIDNDNCICHQIHVEGKSVADVWGSNYHIAKSYQEVTANAKLIACAPEMLEMLQSMFDQYERCGHLLNVSPSKIKQLIKKATTI